MNHALLLLLLLAITLLFGCGVRFGGGGIGGSDEKDVIYYPPGPEIRRAQEAAKENATVTP